MIIKRIARFIGLFAAALAKLLMGAEAPLEKLSVLPSRERLGY